MFRSLRADSEIARQLGLFCDKVAKFSWRCLMVERALGWLGVAVVCCCFASCAKTDTDGVPRDQLPAKVAGIFCRSVSGCCDAAGFAFDSSTCNRAIAA